MLLRKPRSHGEIYNDLEGEIVNLFRVLRDPSNSQRLIELLRLTAFARDEWKAACLFTDDPMGAARRLIVRSFRGFVDDGWRVDLSTGFRANGNRSGTTPAQDWANYPDVLPIAIERLRGVVIENKDAIAVMAQHDAPDTLHYVDPPYVHDTRNKKREHAYTYELTDDDHCRLVRHLKQLEGMVVLSGYPSELSDELLEEWRCVGRPAFSDGARGRIEALSLNDQCAEHLGTRGNLLSGLS